MAANSPALKTYLAGIEPAAAPLVIALDEAIGNANPGFDVGAYVSEAVARHGEYKANTTRVLEAARAGRRPKAGR